MAQANFERIAQFTGEVTSVDPGVIGLNSAQETYNVELVDGKLRVRLGHTLLSAAPSGFSSSLGFKYVSGYDDSYVNFEEIISIEARSGPTYRPYSINVTNGTRTEIKDGTTSLTLTNANWEIVGHKGYAYCFARGGLVYRHEIGDATSWSAIDVPAPADILGSLPITGNQTEDTSTVTDGTNESWATLVGADITGTTNCAFNAVAGTGFTMDKTAVGNCIFTADLPTNPTDLSAVDGFRFNITIPGQSVVGSPPFGATPHSVAVTVNDAGTDTVVMDITYTHNKTTGVFAIEARFPEGTTMADYSDTESITINFLGKYYLKIGGSWIEQTFTFTVSQLTYFTEGSAGAPTPSGDVERVRFGVAAYNAERGAESEVVLASVWLKVDSSPTRWFSDSGTFLGNQVLALLPAPVSPATSVRLYVQFEAQNVWRLVTNQESAGDYTVELTPTQLKALPERSLLEVNPVGEVLCAVAHQGSMVWGTPGGKSNIKISAIGNPPKVFSNSDDLDDETRGANFTLADNFNDQPVAMLSVADGLYIFGSEGVYAMQGQTPTGMTPPKKFPLGLGIISPNATAVFMDTSGNPVVVYIDKAQQAWQIKIVNGLSEYGLRIERFDVRVEGLIRSFLTQTDSPTGEDLAIFEDRGNDAFILAYQTRFIKLSRKNVIEGARQFVRGGYATTWKRFTSNGRKIWAIASGGAIHQLWNGTTDNGTSIENAFWTSGDDLSENDRVARVRIERDDFTIPVTVTVTSDRAPAGTVTSSAVVSANQQYGRFAFTQQGFRHRYKIELTNPAAVVTMLVIEKYSPSSRRLNT